MLKRILLLSGLLILTSCLKFLNDEELKEKYKQCLDEGNYEKALGCIDEMQERNPTDTTLYFSKAFCLYDLNPIEHHRGVLENLSVFLTYNTSSSQGRLLKYGSHYINGEFAKAISEMEQVERVYGISSMTLWLKANAYFLLEDFKQAEFYYDEVLAYPQSKEFFQAIYKYKVLCKYFAGNKEEATFALMHLEDYGYRKDLQLLSLILNDKLQFADYNEIPFEVGIEEFAEAIRPKMGMEYGSLYKPNHLKQLYTEPKRSLEDLKTLNINTEILNLSYSKIKELPLGINRFQQLKALDLSGNQIKDFDKLFKVLSELPNLEYLALRGSNLKQFPASIELLKSLKGLDIQGSNIRQLPKEIGNLPQLSYLNIKNNGRLKDLPEEIKKLKSLNVLDVSGSGMQRLREELSLCYNLIAIIGNASKIKTIPTNIGRLKHLQFLNLGYARLEELPQQIGQITYLSSLHLGGNELESLPESIGQLSQLTMLTLDYNRFKTFPREVLTLHGLYNLWMHNNSFTRIPTEVGQLKRLTHLLVDHEVITDKNIDQIKAVNPKLLVIREDGRQYVKGKKRKQ